jgi:hypothetical protein
MSFTYIRDQNICLFLLGNLPVVWFFMQQIWASKSQPGCHQHQRQWEERKVPACRGGGRRWTPRAHKGTVTCGVWKGPPPWATGSGTFYSFKLMWQFNRCSSVDLHHLLNHYTNVGWLVVISLSLCVCVCECVCAQLAW